MRSAPSARRSPGPAATGAPSFAPKTAAPLDCAAGSGRGGPRLSGHRGDERPHGLHPQHRPRRQVAHLQDDRRRKDVGAAVHQSRIRRRSTTPSRSGTSGTALPSVIPSTAGSPSSGHLTPEGRGPSHPKRTGRWRFPATACSQRAAPASSCRAGRTRGSERAAPPRPGFCERRTAGRPGPRLRRPSSPACLRRASSRSRSATRSTASSSGATIGRRRSPRQRRAHERRRPHLGGGRRREAPEFPVRRRVRPGFARPRDHRGWAGWHRPINRRRPHVVAARRGRVSCRERGQVGQGRLGRRRTGQSGSAGRPLSARPSLAELPWASAPNPIRRRRGSGGATSRRMASNTILNCSSYRRSRAASFLARSALARSIWRSRTNVLMISMLTRTADHCGGRSRAWPRPVL